MIGVSTLISVGSWWKVIKIGMFAAPAVLALWNYSSANSIKVDLADQKKLVAFERGNVEALKAGLVISEQTVKAQADEANRLETSLHELQASRQIVIDQRNNAWAVMGKYEKDKKAYLSSKNLTATEQDYVDCQPIPVPNSRLSTN